MSDLIELQKNYILSSLDCIETDHGIKFLVIDNVVDSIFDFVFPDRNELLRHVAALDKIDSRTRVGQPSVDVIYFLSPTKFNINCIDADFTNVPPKYKKHHIRFLPGYTEEMARFLKSRSYLPRFMVSLDEIKCGFIPKEHQYFETIGIDQSLQIFFNRQCADLIERNIRRAVSSLLNLCIITGEYPIIRYSEPNPEVLSISRPTILAKKLAFEFQAALDDYARQNKDFPPPNPRQRAICIITDRSLDLFSPLVHPFTYQAMAYDLVKDVDVVTDVYSYEAENEQGIMEKKSSKLRDILDPDWVELKHQHIADVSEYLTAKINDMIAKNPLLVDRSKVKTTTDLLSVVAHLKDFDEDRRRITLHKLLIDRCLSIAKSRNLIELSEMEQCLSGYGHDIEGNKVKHLAEDFIYMLADPSPSVTDRIRYIIQYVLLKGGLIEEDLVKLLSFIGVDAGHSFFKHFMQLFRNFECLGFLLIKPNLREGPFKKEWTHSSIMNDPNIYQTSRFIPSVGNLLVNVINNPLLLSESFFPYVKDKPIELLDPGVKPKLITTTSATSLRNPRHKAAWAKSNVQSKIPRQRFFYYILGGVTHIELKAAYTQSQLKNKDVFIGSDNVITPLQFLQSVERLSENRDHLRLADDVRPLFYAPEFLLPKRPPPVGPPQLQSHVDEKRAADIAQHQQPHHPTDYGDAGSTTEKEGEKDKRRHKFTKFLRR